MSSQTHIHSTSRSLVDKAWQLRIDGQIDAALEVFSQIRSSLLCFQEKMEQVQLKKLIGAADSELNLDTVLLHASFCRAQKRMDEHSRILALIESEVIELSLPRPFWLIFERAITSYRSGDFSTALNGFGLAAEKARNTFEKLLSKINFTCCLYGLGQSFEKSLEESNQLLRELQDTNTSEYLNTITEQKIALELFHYFRLGDVGKVLNVSTPKGSPSHFLQAWCAQLPYHRFYQGPSLTEEIFPFNPCTCLEPAYRQRTLMGLLHPSDDRPPRLSDWADRLYLWVWRWLVSPETFPIEKVLKTLSPLKHSAELNLLSVEDRKLVRNAILWLGLFDSSSRRLLETLLKLVEVSELSSYPLLEGEKNVIYYWMSLRDKDDVVAKNYLTSLQRSTLLAHPDLLFNQLINSEPSETERLFSLSARLKKLTGGERYGCSGILIDCHSFKIKNFENQREIISEPIVNAIEVLSETGVCSFEKIAAVSFGISHFDPGVHSAKIYNLLSRMKGIFEPVIRLKTKQFQIYAEGDFSSVHFLNSRTQTHDLFSYPQWREIVYDRLPYSKQSGPADSTSMDLGAPVSREQIQKLCGKSRASAGRIIQSWSKKGWIEKVGNARNTRYQLSLYLQSEIKEGKLLI